MMTIIIVLLMLTMTGLAHDDHGDDAAHDDDQWANIKRATAMSGGPLFV